MCVPLKTACRNCASTEMRWMCWPKPECSCCASDAHNRFLQPWNMEQNRHESAGAMSREVNQRFLKIHEKCSKVVKEELLGRSGTKCLCWLFLLPLFPLSCWAHPSAPHQVQEALLGTISNLSHIPGLSSFGKREALVGKDGCSVPFPGK